MHVIIYDFGTSALKTCLFGIDSEIHLVASSTAAYGLYVLENGGAEQDVQEWWQAVCSSTRELFGKTDVTPEQVSGLAFCSQMQGVVLVDEQGHALRRPMNYMDQRGVREFADCMGKGIVKVSGCSLYKLARNLRVNYAGSTSVKDPVWKYKWVENNEPEVFERVHKWLDVSDYLTSRCTGRIARTADSAFATFLYDTRPGKEGWNEGLVKMYGVRPEHLPPIIECTDLAGELTEEAACDLGHPRLRGRGRHHLRQHRGRLHEAGRHARLRRDVRVGIHVPRPSEGGHRRHDNGRAVGKARLLQLLRRARDGRKVLRMGHESPRP